MLSTTGLFVDARSDSVNTSANACARPSTNTYTDTAADAASDTNTLSASSAIDPSTAGADAKAIHPRANHCYDADARSCSDAGAHSCANAGAHFSGAHSFSNAGAHSFSRAVAHSAPANTFTDAVNPIPVADYGSFVVHIFSSLIDSLFRFAPSVYSLDHAAVHNSLVQRALFNPHFSFLLHALLPRFFFLQHTLFNHHNSPVIHHSQCAAAHHSRHFCRRRFDCWRVRGRLFRPAAARLSRRVLAAQTSPSDSARRRADEHAAADAVGAV